MTTWFWAMAAMISPARAEMGSSGGKSSRNGKGAGAGVRVGAEECVCEEIVAAGYTI